RTFLAVVPAVAAAAAVRTKITAVEFWKVDGHHETIPGVNSQFQVNPLHIYDELRPKPYSDSKQPQAKTVPTSALYLRLGTDTGAEGLYGPIDKEAAIIVDQQLRPFLIGKDPLAG